MRQAPRDRGQADARAGDQRVGGHPGVDVHCGGVERTGADLAVRRLDVTCASGTATTTTLPCLLFGSWSTLRATAITWSAIGDSETNFLMPHYLETVPDGTHFSADDLQIRWDGTQ